MLIVEVEVSRERVRSERELFMGNDKGQTTIKIKLVTNSPCINTPCKYYEPHKLHILQCRSTQWTLTVFFSDVWRRFF